MQNEKQDMTDDEFDAIFESLTQYRLMCIELPEVLPADDWIARFRADIRFARLPGATNPRRRHSYMLPTSI